MARASDRPVTVPRRDFTPEFADAYRDCALAGADMVEATAALEAVRSALASRMTGMRGLEALDDRIVLADKRALRDVLVELRKTLFDSIAEEAVARIEEVHRSDPVLGSVRWLQTYAAALAYWHGDLCDALTEAPIELAGGLPPVEQFRKWTQLMRDARWPEVEELFRLLAERQDIAAAHRANALIGLAQVQMYYLLDTEAALSSLQRAEDLAPDTEAVISAFGEYHLAVDDLDEAEECFARARSMDPRSGAWYLTGDVCESREKPDEAEGWFREGITRCGAKATPYSRLFRLYATTGRLEEQTTRMLSLVEQAAAAGPEMAYAVYLGVADAYEAAGDYAAARLWLEKAIALDPSPPNGHLALGMVAFAAGGPEEAEREFRSVIENAPEAFDGHWHMGWLCEETERYEEALGHFENALSRRPTWEAAVRARLGAVNRKLGRYDDAERELLTALRHTPDDVTARSEADQLADELTSSSTEERAAELLHSIREVVGEGYEAELQNRLANIAYWRGDYSAAAEGYRASLAATPDPVVHRNLAAALGAIGDTESAKAELERALELDGDRKTYDTQLAVLLNTEGNRLVEQGDYVHAREQFAAAVELSDDAVIYSNLAYAILRTTEPGERQNALREATEALNRARELAPDVEEYQVQLEWCEFESRLHERFGEDASWDGERLVYVSVASNLVPQLVVLETYDLTERSHELITEMRNRVRARCSLSAPPVRFAEGEALPESAYSVQLVGHAVAQGSTRDGTALYPGPAADLVGLGVTAEPASRPDTGEPACWVASGDWDKVRSAGHELWEPIEYILRHVEQLLVDALEGAGRSVARPAAR